MYKKVSVIIPVYNVEQYLERCLDSVINQTYKNLEIICVNDCSPDDSIKILKDYSKKDDRIIIINKEKNEGLSAARNSGLKIADGDYIYFLDSDDWIDSNYIEKMVEAIEETNCEVVLNTAINVFGAKNNIAENFFRERALNEQGPKIIEAKLAIMTYVWNTWAHLWKKSFLNRINAQFPNGYLYEDLYFQAITYIHLDKLCIIEKSRYNYLVREKSITNELCGEKKNFDSNMTILNKIADYYIENNLINRLNNVRMMIFGVLPGQKNLEQYLTLKKYFTKIKDIIKISKDVYYPFELEMFDEVMNDFDNALNKNYGVKYMLTKLHNNVIRQNPKVKQ